MAGEQEARWGMSGQRPRLLLADDEKDIRDVLALELSEAGFDVTAVNSGLAAVDALRKSEFDLVITDYKMPGIDGLETAKRLRAIDPELPIIVVTGYAGETTQMEFERSGITDVLLKPFNLETIIELARRKVDPIRRGRAESHA
jgi:CheY-like chemotaxis protein